MRLNFTSIPFLDEACGIGAARYAERNLTLFDSFVNRREPPLAKLNLATLGYGNYRRSRPGPIYPRNRFMSVTTRAAILRGAPGEYETATLQLDEPRRGEVLVRLVSAGLCHSDDHIAAGDIPYSVYPLVGGHEGAGVIEQVGDGVTDLAVDGGRLGPALPAR
jgi:hypothetical protein